MKTLTRRSMLRSDREKIGQRLKQARINAGMTQRQASQEVNLCGTSVAQYETGHATPSVPVMFRLAKAYGVTIDEILRGLEL